MFSYVAKYVARFLGERGDNGAFKHIRENLWQKGRFVLNRPLRNTRSQGLFVRYDMCDFFGECVYLFFLLWQEEQ